MVSTTFNHPRFNALSATIMRPESKRKIMMNSRTKKIFTWAERLSMPMILSLCLLSQRKKLMVITLSVSIMATSS